MASRPQHSGSELKVLQEAVASAVHELSQPLNVLNLLADNLLDDVSSLQDMPGADVEQVEALKRRVETIVEQAAKASDITRWVRAFAVGIGGDATDFDPDAVIERVAGIFTNDLRVAGVDVVAHPSPGTRWASGDEALFAFALTEVVLWLSRTLPEPADGAPEDGSPGRRIRVTCADSPQPRALVVTVDGAPVSDAGSKAAAATGSQEKPPKDLPLLGTLGRASSTTVSLSRPAGQAVRITITLPLSELPADAALGGLR